MSDTKLVELENLPMEPQWDAERADIILLRVLDGTWTLTVPNAVTAKLMLIAAGG